MASNFSTPSYSTGTNSGLSSGHQNDINNGEPIRQLVQIAVNLLSGSRVAPLVVPLIAHYVLIPAVAAGKSVARGFAAIGITFYLIASLFPLFLQNLGLLDTVASVARSNSYVKPLQEAIDHTSRRVTESTLRFLQLNTDDCQLAMACKAGEFMRNEYPRLVSDMDRYGFMNLLNATAPVGDKHWVLIQSMDGAMSCETTFNRCNSMVAISRAFSNLDRNLKSMTSTSGVTASILSQLSSTPAMTTSTTTTTTSTTTTSTTPSPATMSKPTENSVFYNAMYKMAQSLVLGY